MSVPDMEEERPVRTRASTQVACRGRLRSNSAGSAARKPAQRWFTGAPDWRVNLGYLDVLDHITRSPYAVL